MNKRIPFRRVLIAISVIIIVLGLSAYKIIDETIRSHIYSRKSELFHLSLIKKDIILEFNKINVNIKLLSNIVELDNYLQNSSNENLQRVNKEFLNFAKLDERLNSIIVLDNSGNELTRIENNSGNPKIISETELQNKSSDNYFNEISKLSQNQIFLSQIVLDTAYNMSEKQLKPIVKIGAPIFDREGKKRRFLVINYSVESILQNIVKDKHVDMLGAPLLLNSDGYYLSGINKQDEFGFMFEDTKDKKFGTDYPDVWKEMLQNRNGTASNNSGLFTYLTINPNGSKIRNSNSSLLTSENTNNYLILVSYYDVPSIFESLMNFKALFILDFILMTFILLALIAYQKYDAKRLLQEERIRESEHHFRSIVDHAGDAMFLSDTNGIIADVNKRVAEIYGYSREEIIGKPISLLNPEFAITDYKGNLIEKLKINESVTFEREHIRKDGTIIPVEITGSLIEFKGSKYMLNFVRDITKRNEAYKELRKRQQQLAESQEIAKIGSWDWDVINNTLEWSEETYRLFDCDKEDPINYEYFVEKIHPDDRAIVKKAIQETLEKGAQYFIQPRIINDSGREWVMEAFGKVEKDANGKPIRFTGTAQDISERKAQENLLIKSEQRFRNLFQNAPVPIWENDYTGVISELEKLKNNGITDVSRYFENNTEEFIKLLKKIKVIDVNREILRTFNCSDKTELLNNAEKFYNNKTIESFKQGLTALLRGSISWEGETEMLDAQGNVLQISARALRMEQKYGSVTRLHVLISTIDVTEEKLTRLNLKKYVTSLEEAQKIAKIGFYERNVRTNEGFWSEGLYRIFGFQPGEVPPRQESFLKIVHPDDIPEVKSGLEKSLAERKPSDIIHRIIAKDGQVRTMRAICNFVYDDNNEPLLHRGTFIDFTNEERNRIIQKTLSQISQDALKTDSIYDLTKLVHSYIENLMPAENFYIALYHPETNEYSFPYIKDGNITENQLDRMELNGEFIDYVKSAGKPIFADKEFTQRTNSSVAKILGNTFKSALGVPLYASTGVIGVMGTHHYTNAKAFSVEELEYLNIFSEHIARVLERKQLNNSIKSSEEKYRLLVESSIFGIVIHTKGIVKYANKAARNILKFRSRKDMLGLNVLDFIHPEYRKIVMERIKTAQENLRIASEREEKFITFTGEPIDVDVVAIPIQYQGENSSQVVFYDITERKRAQQALKEKEEYIRSVFCNIHENIFIMNRDYVIEDVNRKVLLNSELKREDIVGKHCYEISHHIGRPCDLEGETCYLKSVFEKGESVNYTHIHKNDLGDNLYHDIIMSPIKNNAGEVISVIEAMRDVTDLITAEKSLALSEEKFRMVVESAPEAIITVNPDGKIVSWNKSASKIYGYSGDEIIGENFLKLIPEQSRSKHHNYIKAILENGELPLPVTTPMDVMGLHKNGYNFNAEISVSLGNIENGAFLTLLIRDITQRKAQEEELKKYREQLELLVDERTNKLAETNKQLQTEIEKVKKAEAKVEKALRKEKELNEMKNKFISMASHEFRTPLTSILLSSQMIKRYSKKWEDEKLNKHYDRISSSISNLTQLMDDVLLLGKAESGKTTFNPEKIEIKELLQQFIEEVHPLCTEKHTLKFTNNISPKNLIVDKKLLHQIINNLLTNAIKYSPAGGPIKIETGLEENKLIIKISDMGIGLSTKELKYIFDSFYRTKSAQGIPGTGLGLNIVKKAVELYKGSITVESELNKGTTFIVKLPVEIKFDK